MEGEKSTGELLRSYCRFFLHKPAFLYFDHSKLLRSMSKSGIPKTQAAIYASKSISFGVKSCLIKVSNCSKTIIIVTNILIQIASVLKLT